MLAIWFLVGLGVGSFLNVVIARGARGESITGRSYCESCKKTLRWRELIPIISFVFQKGRCRHCGAALSVQYPLVEGGTAILFALAAWYFFANTAAIPAMLFLFLAVLAVLVMSVIIIASDLLYLIVPDYAVIALGILGVVFSLQRAGFLNHFSPRLLFYDLGGALVMAGILFLLWLVSQGRWIGFGDVKLILATSLVIGYPASFVSFFYAFWLGTFGALFFLATKLKTLKDEMPLGPYILLGALLAYFSARQFIIFTGLYALGIIAPGLYW